jgi:two-component system sensor histidine kinase DesK
MGSVSDPPELVFDRTDPQTAHSSEGAVLQPHASRLAPRLAMGVLVGVFGGFYVLAFLHVWSLTKSVTDLALSGLYMALLLGLQVFYFSWPSRRPRPPMSYLALAAQCCLVFLPMFEFKDAWVGLPGYLAGSLLLTLPPLFGWVAFGAVVASMAFAQYVLTGPLIDVVYTSISTTVTGLIVYGLSRLASIILELHEARTEVARLAVAQERLRFARDLHDLLGYSLSAITLKSELTHRLLIKHPAKAQDELSEILDISRRALSDVRSVASGYRELSLDSEARSARSVLIAADVDVHMDLKYGNLPVQVRTVLATLLREGVTNVLRHSKAERCEITVRQEAGNVRMDIVNDGVPEAPDEPGPFGGSGIHNLSARVAALGGKLSAGLDTDGRFRLQATAPLTRMSA